MQQKLFIEIQKRICLPTGMGIAPEDMPVSIRMPKDLEAEISAIAKVTDRSRNKAILLLLRRGIEAYRADGVLVDTRPFQRESFDEILVEDIPPGRQPTKQEQAAKQRKKNNG